MPLSISTADPFEHLYGTIDPSDGIPFRRPEATEVERGGSGPWPPWRRRYISRRYSRRGCRFRVRVKYKGKLIQVGYFPTWREAAAARDRFLLEKYGERCRGRQRGIEPLKDYLTATVIPAHTTRKHPETAFTRG